MNEVENSHPSRWKDFALMVLFGVIIAVIVVAIFPGKPSVVAQNPRLEERRVAPSPQLTSRRLSGLWENSDGDTMVLIENGTEVKVQVFRSDRIARGDGILTISGDRVLGVLTADFVGGPQGVKGDFQGRIAGPNLIEYTVPGLSVLQRHAASMWRVAGSSRRDVFGKVVGIAYGDTLTVLTSEQKQVKVRLNGIDAPEKEQPFGAKASDLLSNMVGGKSVRVVICGEDRYGREIGDVFLRPEHSAASDPEVNVNSALVANGFAWHYVQYAPDNKDLAEGEKTARRLKLGLWAAPRAVAPWDWRKQEADKRTTNK